MYHSETVRNEGRLWQAFRDTKGYKAAVEVLKENQHNLCSYCETKLNENNRQIEHFKPKSRSDRQINYTFDYSNLMLCFLGGTNITGSRSESASIRGGHSCGQKKRDRNPHNVCLNPYNLPNFPFFKLAAVDGDKIIFQSDEVNCKRAGIKAEIADSTIECLGLNCNRLAKKRYLIWESVSEELEEIRRSGGEFKDDELLALAEEYQFQSREFCTTFLLTVLNGRFIWSDDK
jgi:uncharacterized protein (TIGR02646 family)